MSIVSRTDQIIHSNENEFNKWCKLKEASEWHHFFKDVDIESYITGCISEVLSIGRFTGTDKLDLTTKFISIKNHAPNNDLPLSNIISHTSGILPEIITRNNGLTPHSRENLLKYLDIVPTVDIAIRNISEGSGFGVNDNFGFRPVDHDYTSICELVSQNMELYNESEVAKLARKASYMEPLLIDTRHILKERPYTSIRQLYIRARNKMIGYLIDADDDKQLSCRETGSLELFYKITKETNSKTLISDYNTDIDMSVVISDNDAFDLMACYATDMIRMTIERDKPGQSTIKNLFSDPENFRFESSYLIADTCDDFTMYCPDIHGYVVPGLFVRKHDDEKSSINLPPTVYEMLDNWKENYIKFRKNIIFRGMKK